MKAKARVPRTLPAALNKIARLNRQVGQYTRAIHDQIIRAAKAEHERAMMAMLAADGPCFFNPLDIAAAKTIRDRILREQCALRPDGQFIRPSPGLPGEPKR